AVRAPQGARRGSARHLRLHALLQLHRGVPEGRRADEPDHAPAPRYDAGPPHRRPQQRRAARARIRFADSRLRPAARAGAAAALLRRRLVVRQVPPGRRPAAARVAAGPRARACDRQVHAQEGAARPQNREHRPEGRQGDLREGRGQGQTLRAEPLHLGLRGRRRDRGTTVGGRVRHERKRVRMKVAYWPGCVSRGFTPELHGSMAAVAPLLDIELVELDRACCTGAGVIAEHSQELADTLNARTFALAQAVQDAALMMNICSTCQGAQSESQERLDANTEYRDHVNGTLAAEGLSYEKGLTNKNFLWLLVEEIGLDALKAKVKRPLTGLKVGPFYGCYIVR